MMSLNLKLQSSASKNQAKNIELEIKKLEARETRELLSIVQVRLSFSPLASKETDSAAFQPYLPQLYVESDSDATSCYLFFQRLAYKADLINTVVAQAHGLPESLNGSVSEVLVGVCEVSYLDCPYNQSLIHLRLIDEKPYFRPIDPLQTLRSNSSSM